VDAWPEVEGAVGAGEVTGAWAVVVLDWSVVLLGLGAVVVDDAVVEAVSSWRPQPARAAMTARAVAASVSLLMGISLLW
jgi:hypothetical protein